MIDSTLRERITRQGLSGLLTHDLLAIVMSSDLAHAEELLSKAFSLVQSRGVNRLIDLSRADFQEFGVEDEAQTLRLIAAIELGRRIGLSNKGTKNFIKNASDVYQRFLWLQNESKEFFCVLLLDTKMGILGERVIHVGTLNMSLVGGREVFRDAIREGAASVILVHNHPSGDATPSSEDYEVTERLAQLGEMLDIIVTDHLIVGHNGYYSFKEMKYL